MTGLISPSLRAAAESVATTEEILTLIAREGIAEFGCGAVDAALLASTLLTPGTQLWTSDRPLASLAQKLGVRFDPA